MARVFLIILLIAGIGIVAFQGIKAKIKQDLAQPFSSTITSPSSAPLPKRIPATGSDTTSLYVPYWTVKNADFMNETYDYYLYFGITPTKNGVDRDESGYANLDQFIAVVPTEKKKLLVLRMLDAAINTAILRNATQQKKVIGETISIASEQGFDGVVLDLELSAIPFDSLIAQIRDFNAAFYDRAKAVNLSYGIAIYGDTFYRLRPFDVKAIAKKTDMMYVMAYDFHKARGNPGPNFPLSGEETYGYDIATMSEDFLRYVPAERLTIVYGLFGYDWEVDDKGKSIGQGSALSYSDIANEYLENCEKANCVIKREATSAETQIQYTDDAGTKHVVWFEDSESVEAKETLLRRKGINNFSFWANGYF